MGDKQHRLLRKKVQPAIAMMFFLIIAFIAKGKPDIRAYELVGAISVGCFSGILFYFLTAMNMQKRDIIDSSIIGDPIRAADRIADSYLFIILVLYLFFTTPIGEKLFWLIGFAGCSLYICQALYVMFLERRLNAKMMIAQPKGVFLATLIFGLTIGAMLGFLVQKNLMVWKP